MKKQKRLTPDVDAYGQELWAHVNGLSSYEIIERQDGYIDTSTGASWYFAEIKDWPECERRAIKLAKGRVLDVGCGAGRVILHLQKQGLKTTGIDNSPLAIKTCRKRGCKNAMVRSIEQIGAFPEKTFDTVLMYGNNFGLFGSKNKMSRLLRALDKITTDDAVILATSKDVRNPKDPIHAEYQSSNVKRGRMPGQMRIRVRFKRFIGPWFDYLMVSPPEMAELLKSSPWEIKKIIPDRRGAFKLGGFYCAVLRKKKPG